MYRNDGVIESHQLTVNYERGTKRLPAIHRLKEKGADLVESMTAKRPPRPARSDPLSPLTIPHRLGTVKTVLSFKDACKTAGLPFQFILEQDTYPDAKPEDPATRRFILCEAWGHGSTRATCRPDACLLVELPGSPPWPHVLYLEFDSGSDSESIKEVATKVPGYATLLDEKSKHYRRHWPCIDPTLNRDLARVLFVTSSPKRIQNITAVIEHLPVAEYFRFATIAHAWDPHKELTDIWTTIAGETLPILPPPSSS